MAVKLVCPQCGGNEFERRGYRRVYIQLDSELQDDGWDEGEIEMIDLFDNDDEIIYCLSCDAELHADSILNRD